ncbi:MAG: thermonuclease family protein [Pseudomonadota bacterium]|nr:thermonuclease family protein [Pseudomonadota bacterium]
MKHITMVGICLWSLVCAQAYASIYEGKVVGVSDGDTLTVLISGRQTKVRLVEIDAPEKRQPFGERSKQSLSDLVYGKRVKVSQQDRDRYGRVVGRVYTESLDVNAEQIKRGVAWIYRIYNRDRSLLALEYEARGAKRGPWIDPNPIPPWEYQQGGKTGWVRRSTVEQVQAKAIGIGGGQCADKRCNEMASCDEAKFYLSQCGLSRLDGDGDGVPCEYGLSATANSQETVETIIPDFAVTCTNTGQLCDPPFSVSVETGSILQVQYFVRSTHCSSVRVHIFVDGTLEMTTGFLGWPGAPSPFAELRLDTGLAELGPVSPGAHLISVQVEGQVSGCNLDQPLSWGGSLKVLTSPLATTVRPPVLCNGLPATIVADRNSNTIFATPGNDVIHGLTGNDTIFGLGGDDVICGGPGRDKLYGNSGNDKLFGGAVNDVLKGGTGRDRLFGQSGNDAMDGQSGSDRCDGGSGTDKATRCERRTRVP